MPHWDNSISSHNNIAMGVLHIDLVRIRIHKYYIITKVEAHMSCAFMSDS